MAILVLTPQFWALPVKSLSCFLGFLFRWLVPPVQEGLMWLGVQSSVKAIWFTTFLGSVIPGKLLTLSVSLFVKMRITELWGLSGRARVRPEAGSPAHSKCCVKVSCSFWLLANKHLTGSMAQGQGELFCFCFVLKHYQDSGLRSTRHKLSSTQKKMKGDYDYGIPNICIKI